MSDKVLDKLFCLIFGMALLTVGAKWLGEVLGWLVVCLASLRGEK